MNALVAVADRPGRWRDAFAERLPEMRFHLWPAEAPSEVDVALVWKPDPEAFRRVRIRRAIFNLGAGVDALLALPGLPADVPIVRLEDAGMAEQMAEYALLAVLRAFRDALHYERARSERRWAPIERREKASFGVGILGAGVLARSVARAIAPLGFPLATWSRTPHVLPGVESFTGSGALHAFLARSAVVIGLLPSTPDTRDLMDERAFAAMPRGAHVVNLGRGDLIVEEALVAALDRGHLGHATLDVFRTEPLSADHPFWHHAGITITPHVSAVTRVADTVAQVAAKLEVLERGGPLSGVIDRNRGY